MRSARMALRIARRVPALLLLIALVAGWFFLFRPASLGGPVSYLIVSGSSMEPGMSSGDFVIVRKGEGYQAGETIAYPASGGIVIHRIVGEDAGAYVTQGDNSDTPDFWRPTSDEVLGRQWVRLPYAGHIIMHLTPTLLAAIAGAVAAFSVLLRRDAPANERRKRRGWGMGRLAGR